MMMMMMMRMNFFSKKKKKKKKKKKEIVELEQISLAGLDQSPPDEVKGGKK